MTKETKKVILPQIFNQTYIPDTLFLISVTMGIVLMIAGLATIILPTTLPSQFSDLNLLQNSITQILSILPGIPLIIQDLSSYGLTAIGITTWIVGIDLLAVGLGLWRKNNLAKWVAILIFALGAYFDFVQFLLSGLIGAPTAIIGLALNVLVLFLLWKANFKVTNLDIIKPDNKPNLTGIKTEENKTATFVEIDAKKDSDLVIQNQIEPKGDVALVKESYIESKLQETDDKTEKNSNEKRFIIPKSEVRLIIRDLQDANEKEQNTQSNSRTQVIVRRTKDGIPVIIVETKNKSNAKVSIENSKQQNEK
jgi:hypothetical protein